MWEVEEGNGRDEGREMDDMHSEGGAALWAPWEGENPMWSFREWRGR